MMYALAFARSRGLENPPASPERTFALQQKSLCLCTVSGTDDIGACILQEKAGSGKVSGQAVVGISAAFQQMAGKIADFPWDAATGANLTHF